MEIEESVNAEQRLGFHPSMIDEVDFDFLKDNPDAPLHRRGTTF